MNNIIKLSIIQVIKICLTTPFLILDYMILSNTSRIIGVWDDHDYGENNGNINNRVKHQMRDIFLDFIEEP
jgi:hypothetical protein